MAESIRFYFDEHVWGSAARGLTQRGLDVLTAQDAGQCGATDRDQLAFATAEERVMVTFDPDYLALHQAGTTHAGIAWCQERKYSTGQLIQLLQLLHDVTDRDGMRNQIEYL